MEKNYIFSGFDTVALAKEYGTPLYVVSEDIIRKKCREVRETFLEVYSNTQAVYASKAFLTKAMCKIIEEEGLGLDVVSGGELFTAKEAGFPMEKVIFHGNNKSMEELKMAIDYGVGRIVMDHEEEIHMIEALAKGKNQQVPCLFRITPSVEGKTHKYIMTGQKDSKFGIPLELESLKKLVGKAKNSSVIDLKGFHFHIGSQLFENHIYEGAVKTIGKLAKDLKADLDLVVEELNVGGGFGIQYRGDEQTKPVSFFTEVIRDSVQRVFEGFALPMPKIIIEPGRWIVGEAGITLYTIGAIKEIPGVRTYASVDGGFPDNPRPALYGAKYDGVIANKVREKNERVATIAGKCCESGDILIWDLPVPKLEAGDVLAVKNTGAYNYSMASNYNKLPKPAVLLLSGTRASIIVKGENYRDLLRKETLPPHLRE